MTGSVARSTVSVTGCDTVPLLTDTSPRRTGAFIGIGRAGGEQEGGEGRAKEQEQAIAEPQGERGRKPPASCRLRVRSQAP